jgi:hypothetical protein
MPVPQLTFRIAIVFLASCLVLAPGCMQSGKGGGEVSVATATQAESQLQGAFINAPDDLNRIVNRLVEALRSTDHEGAVRAVLDLRARKDLTPAQAIALHESEVTIVNRLASAMQSGDGNAKKAYEYYQENKR